MTTSYIAHSMLKGYQAKDSVYVAILDAYDIYMLPIANPDGFVNTWTSDRL